MQDAQCVDATTPPPAHPFNIHIFKQHTPHLAGWHEAVHPGREVPKGEAAIDTAALGAVGAYKGLTHFTRAGGVLTIYTLGD